MAELEPMRYVIVSPVKDEERHVRRTLQSVAAQTIRPLRWIIVDDGSSDQTPSILHEFAAIHEWTQIFRIERGAKRDLGVTEICAFAKGYELVRDLDFDLVVKLDCDLELPHDYFERIIAEFSKNGKLGIASGMYLEEIGGTWLPAHMPSYHAAGASKVVRRQCFDAIGGFILFRGWDTIDEIKALIRGWQTRHFTEITFLHLKKEGSAMGSRRTNLLHGEIYFLTGGGFFFLLLKVAHRCITGRPVLLGGCAMFWGYLKCVLQGRQRQLTSEELSFYRRMLNDRLRRKALSLVGLARTSPTAWSNQ